MKERVASSQKPAGSTTGRRGSSARFFLPLLLATGYWLLASSSPAPAQPTQEEVFKSIGDSVNEPLDTSRVMAVVAGIGGVIVLLVVVGQRRQRDPKSR